MSLLEFRPEATSGSVTAELGKIWHHGAWPRTLAQVSAQALPNYFRMLVILHAHKAGFFLGPPFNASSRRSTVIL